MIVCPVCEAGPHIDKHGFWSCSCDRLRAYSLPGSSHFLWEFRYGHGQYIEQENDQTLTYHRRSTDAMTAVRLAIMESVMEL